MYFLQYTSFFEQLGLPWKTEFALKFFIALKFFYLSGFLSNLRLPWKQSLHWKFSLYGVNIFFTFRIFEQLALALKYRVRPEFTLLKIHFYLSGFLNNLHLPWKQSLPWFHCIEFVLFIIQNFEQLALALKNENFSVLKYFSPCTIFERLALALKTEFALIFSDQGRGRPTPATG